MSFVLYSLVHTHTHIYIGTSTDTKTDNIILFFCEYRIQRFYTGTFFLFSFTTTIVCI